MSFRRKNLQHVKHTSMFAVNKKKIRCFIFLAFHCSTGACELVLTGALSKGRSFCLPRSHLSTDSVRRLRRGGQLLRLRRRLRRTISATPKGAPMTPSASSDAGSAAGAFPPLPCVFAYPQPAPPRRPLRQGAPLHPLIPPVLYFSTYRLDLQHSYPALPRYIFQLCSCPPAHRTEGARRSAHKHKTHPSGF